MIMLLEHKNNSINYRVAQAGEAVSGLIVKYILLDIDISNTL